MAFLFCTERWIAIEPILMATKNDDDYGVVGSVDVEEKEVKGGFNDNNGYYDDELVCS